MSTISLRGTPSRRYDPVTWLPDRQALLTELSELLRTVNSHDGIGALLLIDINRFRFSGEVQGPEASDAVLCHVGRGLRTWAADRFVMARTGTGEFAIAFIAGPDTDVPAIAHQAREAVSAACATGAPQVSIGAATFSCGRSPTVSALLGCAGNAVREAKQNGSGSIVSYGVEDQWGIGGAEWILQAVAEDRLIVDAQPIVDLSNGEVVRHELLVRALNRDGHLVAPGAFVPTAERFGLMPLIDRWMVDYGLTLALEGRPVSINLSAQSTTAAGPLVAMVESAIARGLQPANVMFEITETVAMSDPGVGYNALHALAELGCPLALDDFGVGYGCFSYLKHVPAEVVKIDREFIGDFSHDRTNLAVVLAVTQLARELGMETVAEGIEDGDALSVVASAGVRYAQGYFLGRPTPIVPAAPQAHNSCPHIHTGTRNT